MLSNNNQKPEYFYKFSKKPTLMEVFVSKSKTCPAKRGRLCPLIHPLCSCIRKISFKFDLSTIYVNVDFLCML